MEWYASIKPTNANIPALINDEYAFEEIQIMICTLTIGQLENNAERCIQLFQKYIPYQIVMIVEDENDFIINTCDKRINQNDKSKRTIEKFFTTTLISKLYKNELITSFFNALNFEKLDKANMQTTYKSYIQAIIQYKAASITGVFQKRSNLRTEEDVIHLAEIENIEKDIISLKSQIKKERDFRVKMNLNIEIQTKKREIQKLKLKL